MMKVIKIIIISLLYISCHSRPLMQDTLVVTEIEFYSIEDEIYHYKITRVNEKKNRYGSFKFSTNKRFKIGDTILLVTKNDWEKRNK